MEQPTGHRDGERILVGVDFSTTAERALAYAVRLAERLGGTLALAYIYPPPVILTPEAPIPPLDDSAAIAGATRELEALGARATGGRIPVRTYVRTDFPASGLLELTRELRPDLVVVGSHGKGAVMRALMGSVAEALCRRSPVPLLVVPDPARAAA